jgi:hypothetical protein
LGSFSVYGTSNTGPHERNVVKGFYSIPENPLLLVKKRSIFPRVSL